jgi:hypothetical protein
MPKAENRMLNQQLIRDLISVAVAAVEKQNYFEASIILFQTVEGLLRIAVKLFGEAQGASKRTLEKCADNETSFWRLVLHLDMIRPDNVLSRQLLALNARRNKIMHRLFYDFDSMEQLQRELRSFCEDAMAVNVALQETLRTPEM